MATMLSLRGSPCSARGGQRALQPVDERGLRADELPPCRFEVEPVRAIDLWKLSLPSGPRRPLDRERVARQTRRVEVSFDRPRHHPLAARLTHVAECEHRPVRRRAAGLLLEL